jgi:probable rRNA maturation factor
VSGVEVSAAGLRKPVWAGNLARYCSAVCGHLGVRSWELSVLLCDDATIARLNGRYRRKRGPTDVLSFRQEDRNTPGVKEAVGDLVISLPTVKRNAKESGVSWDEELRRVATHGILHLAGMDHGRGMGAAMIELQEKLVSRLGRRRIVGISRRR